MKQKLCRLRIAWPSFANSYRHYYNMVAVHIPMIGMQLSTVRHNFCEVILLGGNSPAIQSLGDSSAMLLFSSLIWIGDVFAFTPVF